MSSFLQQPISASLQDDAETLNEHALPSNFAEWKRSPGPVLATAVHAGHQITPDLEPYLEADEAKRRRDEDPLTGILASSAYSSVIVRRSRFEVDLNRSEERCICTDPEETWGVRFWREAPPEILLARSRRWHRQFYERAHTLIETMLTEHPNILVLDVHSYNHQRAGEGVSGAQEDNPDIDIGITEAEWSRWGPTIDRFAAALRETPVGDREPDVRYNVRYPDGGHFPEWINEQFDARVCTVTLEYKKFFMEEWTELVYLQLLEDLRFGLDQAIDRIRGEFEKG